MALPSSGTITLSQVAAEFGKATNLGALYGVAIGVPASGPISLSSFYGKSAQFILNIGSNIANVNLRDTAVAAGWNGSSKVIINLNCQYANTINLEGLFPLGVRLNISAGTLLGGVMNSGTALRVRTDVEVNNLGKIYGGGSKGPSGGYGYAGYQGSGVFYAYGGEGGNGQGFYSTSSFYIEPPGSGAPGDYQVYGGAVFGGHTPPWAAGGYGGTGGAWGESGTPGGPGSYGGTADPGGYGESVAYLDHGYYIDGNSYVTWVSAGDCRGRIY